MVERSNLLLDTHVLLRWLGGSNRLSKAARKTICEGLGRLSISPALAAGALPPHHGDPFDRMRIAQARAESLTLLTSDSRLESYGARVLLV
jgi:PIN domain nuclease of toxin-antitoxin system